MRNFLVVLEFILALALMIVVLMQPSKADGLKGFITGGSETFFSKNKSRTKEALLVKLTVVTAVLFAITTLALNIV
ncbi:preprotein translocase subunit SecG [Clostridium algidicarnis]|uniref:preprotein translocase subunit SecG n=1 Tax=Clostridium algidicarnis TaxID=37659 RepID=UPI001C0E1EA8|nr:preprotein translocase subunit SecG [Clostridium algidicarnis]MBU3203974.1 preprotein translocase subunit SecG [Clostridium algidicarnis]MBU3212128.1 preprotein translocase subunit SecG [Clostridium algidicarnis]MBU3221367.1 preprotein translocase subunit SecG [Clostridium algidicarnis]